ncbi:MAG: stage V sporulation protein AD, partial [Ruminococcus sp.]|nr:stage V sporulation protein AD [Ruminococcus sp.]
MVKKLGTGTLLFENMPRVEGFASVVGKKESEGPLGALFDKTEYDSRGGCETFEEAESRLQQEAARLCMEKADLRAQELDAVFAGDLLNQCTGSSFGLMHYGAPYLGQYGACSTMAQALLMAAVFTESGAADHALCVTSSHFCAAERQYRFPMEYGAVRTPTAQWTVTGAGSCILGKSRGKVAVRAAAVGKIQDMGVTDANNMGAAMAPAAADTILRFLRDSGTAAEDYDRIVTGDLGLVGSGILYDLLRREGVDAEPLHDDCGLLIFD